MKACNVCGREFSKHGRQCSPKCNRAYNLAKGMKCECGQIAVAYHDADYVCQRCHDLEVRYYQERKEQEAARRAPKTEAPDWGLTRYCAAYTRREHRHDAVAGWKQQFKQINFA